MTTTVNHFATLLQGFFTRRLMQERHASAHTIASYRDTFRLFLRFAYTRLGTRPSALALEQLDAALIAAFLAELEDKRGVCVRSRNLRLSAIRSFFQYVAFESPHHSAQIQRILAIPSKRFTRIQICHLTRAEVETLLAAPDPSTWSGRRDHALLLVTVQTGLRLSELTGLRPDDVSLGTGAHVHVLGKGRKERCTPLAKRTQAALRSWMHRDLHPDATVVFPNARGGPLSADGVQYILAKHVATAVKTCASLARKRITFHVLRHTMAMELLRAGVDRPTIAMWLGHESIETTQIYLDADLTLKEKVLDQMAPHSGRRRRYRPDDRLMAFLNAL